MDSRSPLSGIRIAAPGFPGRDPKAFRFPGKYHEAIEDIAGLIRVLVAREEVHLNVPNDNYERIVRDFLRARRIGMRRVFFHHIPTNEAWARDHGPAFVLRSRRGKTEAAIVDWGFNAWGGKYPPWDADDNVPTRIAEELQLPVFYPGIVMEGGAVDFNGAGTVLTTTSCLLNRNRNPRLRQGFGGQARAKARIEKYLRDYYGQKHVLWLGEGIEGDDTDGHIDDLARFIDERTIAIGIESSKRDPNYAILQKARRAIESFRDQDGRPFEVVELPMPKPLAYDGQRVPATYVNFYFANGGAAGADIRPARSRSASHLSTSAAPATTRSYWRRLPQTDLGPRRDSLLYAAAAALLALFGAWRSGVVPSSSVQQTKPIGGAGGT